MHLTIYSPILSPRIKYIFNFIFKDILQAEIEFTNNETDFKQSPNIKISYADQPLGDELFFKRSALMLSKKLSPVDLETIPFGDYKVPFPVRGSALAFDVFAASFFILTRYEEYLDIAQGDAVFSAKNSLQYKWHLLDAPVIDEWALIIKNMIRKKHPDFKFPDKNLVYQATINFTLKPDTPTGFLAKTKFIFGSVFNKKQTYLSRVFDDLSGLGTNTEEVIARLNANRQREHFIYFINFPADPKNTDQYKNSMGLLKHKSIGLFSPCFPHAGWSVWIKQAIAKIKAIDPSNSVLKSQQLDHLTLPTCYLNLLSAGIMSDYSMGYPNTPGFRAGTCSPFYWYDLQLDKVTSLHIKPYCISDTALQKLDDEKAATKIKAYTDAVKLVQGHFYSSWQLKSLSGQFKNMQFFFNEVLNQLA